MMNGIPSLGTNAYYNTPSSYDNARTARNDSYRADSSRADASRTDASRTDASRTDASRTDALRTAPARSDFSRPEALMTPPERYHKEQTDRMKEQENSNGECETCKKRKYQDGSNEMVSFKTAQHISPESAAGAVRAHEQEHVSNAYKKAELGNGKVLRASVSIHTAICPECGRSYVSGGTTSTQIKYYNEENPYQKDLKASDHAKYAGMAADYTI